MAEHTLGSDLKSAAKSKAVRGITGSLFGSGIVGSALKKSFQRKFADKASSEDTSVVDALHEQEKVISDNDMTLVRIERIVMNIADNIYNIAGIMNAQVVSMREAERIREQARSRDMAAREEALSESTREIAPTAAATEQTKPEESKGGLVSSLMGTVGKTKRMFGSFLKKFGVAALAVTGTLAAATAAIASSQGSSDQEPGEETTVESGTGVPTTPPSVDQNDGSYDTAEAARLSRNASAPSPSPAAQASPVQQDGSMGQMMSMFSQMASSVPGGEQATARLKPFTAAMASENPVASFIAAAQDDAARNPQPQQPPAPPPAPAPEPTAVSQPQLSASTPAPKSTAELIESTKQNIEFNNKRLGQREQAYEKRVAIIRQRYASEPDKMKEMLDNEARGIEDYRKMVNDSNATLEDRVKQLEAQGKQTQGPGTSSASASPPAGGGGGVGGGSSSPGGAGGSSSGGASATPMIPSPSTGADVGSASTQLAASLNTPSATAPAVQAVTAESASSSVGGQSASVLPSPVADRGSLDKGLTFESSTN